MSGANGNSRKHLEEQAQVDVWKYVFGFTDMAVVKCAIELGIADVLENNGEPMALSDLSTALGCSQSSLYRIMRFLIHRNIFNEIRTPQGLISYVQTPMSRIFTKNGEKSMAAFVMLESSAVMLAPWHALSKRVLANGKPAFESAHEKDVWNYAADNPGHSKLIDDAMACDARLVIPAIIEGCSDLFDGVKSVVDVGGGNGTAMGILVKKCPWIKGINFDLPHVVLGAPDCVGAEHVGGDMFEVVPSADAAFLMWVLHDWGDDECIEILKKCREAIPKDKGKVIIVEAVVGHDDNNTDNNHGKDQLEYVRLMLDMVMMAHTNNGKERTIEEWGCVLSQAGFSRHIVKKIQAVQSVIVAFP